MTVIGRLDRNGWIVIIQLVEQAGSRVGFYGVISNLCHQKAGR